MYVYMCIYDMHAMYKGFIVRKPLSNVHLCIHVCNEYIYTILWICTYIYVYV